MGNKHETDFANELIAELNEAYDFNIHTFEDEGLLTNNAGIIITDEAGRTYQLTIVQSAGPDEDDEEDFDCSDCDYEADSIGELDDHYTENHEEA